MSTRAPALRAAPAPPRPARVVRPTRHLRVVDPEARRRQRRLRRAVWLFAVVSVASVFVAVAFRTVLAQSQVELDHLAKQTVAEQRRYEELRLEVATLAAPDHIVARAEQLGLVQAQQPRYLSAPVPDPNDPSASTGAPGPDTTAPTRAADWGKVKPHLVAQP